MSDGKDFLFDILLQNDQVQGSMDIIVYYKFVMIIKFKLAKVLILVLYILYLTTHGISCFAIIFAL